MGFIEPRNDFGCDQTLKGIKKGEFRLRCDRSLNYDPDAF